MLSIPTSALLLVGLGTFAAASDSTNYVFRTHKIDSSRRQILRHRRAKENGRIMREANIAVMPKEDQAFWDRMLADEMGSVRPPTTPTTPSPTTAPSSCPTRVQVDCVEVSSGTPCSELEPPEGNTGDQCVVAVEYTYTITNDSPTEAEQIYTLVVTRGDTTTIVTDIPDAIPTVILGPGESVTAPETLELDICGEAGVAVFDTKADIITGPPSSVMVEIACESEEGVECREISDNFNVEPDPDACLVDVIYTYTVSNTGQSDFNIILFSRERNGEFVDLMPLLGTKVFLEVGGTTAVQESEQIDRCIDQSFSTTTIVTKLPPADMLCPDTTFYPAM